MKQYFKNLKLQSQLIIVSLSSIIISFILILVILPNILTPFYENNIYKMLEQPLQFINSEYENNTTGKTAYIIYSNDKLILSNNIHELLNTNNVNDIFDKINNSYGKFIFKNNTYYYNTKKLSNGSIIVLTNDNYIIEQQKSLNRILIPVMLFTLTLAILIPWIYSSYLVRKVGILKKKIDNIDNNKYKHDEVFALNDELNSLLNSIEDTRTSLQEKEKQKSSMFQNISHELKTPIMVISSHIEALNDKVITKDKALKVIKEETEILNKKVSLIMKLNKLNYLDSNTSFKEIDIVPILNKSFSKFKVIRKDVDFVLKIENKTNFIGTEENWETVINNILENFTRFADKKIEVTIDKDNIKFYNDGKHIKESLLKDIFEPYKVDSNGKHGLGLAIVKQTLILSGYKIKANNLDVGVSFEIYRK